MTLIWSLITWFLYIEIAIVLLLISPLISPSKWNRFFKSRFLAAFARQSHKYFYHGLGVLVLFLLEAIHEMRKFSHMEEETTLNLGMQHSISLFRAQRNFFIAGFTIFLSLVIRRLIILISKEANSITNSEASMRQAHLATGNSNDDSEKAALKKTIKNLKEELQREIKDKEALMAQSLDIVYQDTYNRISIGIKDIFNRISIGTKEITFVLFITVIIII